MDVPSAFLIREPAWRSLRGVYEVVGETTIGGHADDVLVDVDGPLAVVAWRDGAWRIRPCSPAIAVDDHPLSDELELRHGAMISGTDRSHGMWRVRFLIGERETLLDELRHAESIADGLTSLLNRRVAYQALERMTTGVVMLIDLDHLKRINDHFGMLAGDTAIKRTAGILRDHVRWPSVVARYGGEEFMVLMPDASLDGARVLAEQLRVATEPTIELEGERFTATISIGLAAHTGEGTIALRAADEALMQAKRAGRNRVVG